LGWCLSQGCWMWGKTQWVLGYYLEGLFNYRIR
jgi:hypothetical protein